ncbi:MAG: UDP-N-acetylmuramate--L-alanine ligase [Gammaproteobacteria bacterium]|nr:UDP-N-acetylmuramate--L-alanine ligase [Gammaproteobacteria bacterium]
MVKRAKSAAVASVSSAAAAKATAAPAPNAAATPAPNAAPATPPAVEFARFGGFVERIHFVGIGGIGMSGIAEVLLELGFQVSGSDASDSAQLARLRAAGARIAIGHRAENIAGAEVVVASSAVGDANPELAAARAANIPLLPRAQMLGELMRFRRAIAVAGTHGKTTTTSLVAAVLARAGLDPTFIVGGVVNSVRSNARLGRGEFMVVEADESDASFLHLQPQMAVLTNIDADHLATYGGDFEQLKATCLAFLRNLPFYGLAALCAEDAAVRDIAADLRKPAVTYGFGAGVDFRGVEVRQVGRDSFFRVETAAGIGAREYRLALPGRHNVLNALAAIAIAARLNLPEPAVAQALAEFEGIGRRFQALGEIAVDGDGGGDGDGAGAGAGTVELVDDYAHHPTELAATLAAARDCWPGRRLVVVFQPHRYTRTRDLFDDFVQVLAGVEHLVVTQVYAAGEEFNPAADSKSLCRALRKLGREPVFIEDLPALGAHLPGMLRGGDVLLTLGAGDIGRFAREFAGRDGDGDGSDGADDGRGDGDGAGAGGAAA